MVTINPNPSDTPSPAEDPSDGTSLQTAVLEVLDTADGPVGARDLRRGVQLPGLPPSEATMSRRLRDLDRRGLTVGVGRKGRVITDEGRRALRSGRLGRAHAALWDRLGQVRSAEDLRHLLEARRAIEPEAVRGAASSPDADVVRQLRSDLRQHDAALPGPGEEQIPRALVLGFHRSITSMTGNPLVAAMTRIALDPSLDHVEAMLDVILQTRHTSRESVAEHAAILDAVATGRSDDAAQAMLDHLDRLIAETDEFVRSQDPALVQRLLAGEGQRRTR